MNFNSGNNFIFFGSPKFAEIILNNLIKSDFKPHLIVCSPDRPLGRKQIITPPPVKILAGKNNIKIYQPEKLDIKNWQSEISENFDFAIVAAYSKIIPKEILKLFPLGIIGVHPSLLPKYRGASPIQSAILSGEEESGVSLYLIDEKMDHGPVFLKKKISIKEKSYPKAEEALAILGGEMLVNFLPDFISGKISPLPQNHAAATFTKKIKTEDGFIELSLLKKALAGDPILSKTIYQKILALNPNPGIYTINSAGKRIKLLSAALSPSPDKKLILKQIQPESKTPTSYLPSSNLFS